MKNLIPATVSIRLPNPIPMILCKVKVSMRSWKKECKREFIWPVTIVVSSCIFLID